jgi:hypothetical protein
VWRTRPMHATHARPPCTACATDTHTTATQLLRPPHSQRRTAPVCVCAGVVGVHTRKVLRRSSLVSAPVGSALYAVGGELSKSLLIHCTGNVRQFSSSTPLMSVRWACVHQHRLEGGWWRLNVDEGYGARHMDASYLHTPCTAAWSDYMTVPTQTNRDAIKAMAERQTACRDCSRSVCS